MARANFYRDVWRPTQETAGLDIRPHKCCHSYLTHLRAVGVNDADLAEIAGHRAQTMLARCGFRFPVDSSGYGLTKPPIDAAERSSKRSQKVLSSKCAADPFRIPQDFNGF